MKEAISATCNKLAGFFDGISSRLDGPGRIPRLIHQIWNDDAPPEAFEEFRETWRAKHKAKPLNWWADKLLSRDAEDWRVHLWTFESGADFLARFYPKLFTAFHRLPKVIQKADLLRYAILHHYGGIYADLDTECLRPFDPILEGADFVAGYEAKDHASICNAILCSAPRHPILAAVLRHLERMPDDRTRIDAKDVGHVFATTGSLMLTPIILAHQTPRTRLMPPHVFYPFSWDEKHRCNEEFPGSFAKHYWVSGWYEEGRYRVEEYWNKEPDEDDVEEWLRKFDESIGGNLINGVDWRQELIDRAARCISVDYTPRQMTPSEIESFNERLLSPYREEPVFDGLKTIARLHAEGAD